MNTELVKQQTFGATNVRVCVRDDEENTLLVQRSDVHTGKTPPEGAGPPEEPDHERRRSSETGLGFVDPGGHVWLFV